MTNQIKNLTNYLKYKPHPKYFIGALKTSAGYHKSTRILIDHIPSPSQFIKLY